MCGLERAFAILMKSSSTEDKMVSASFIELSEGRFGGRKRGGGVADCCLSLMRWDTGVSI